MNAFNRLIELLANHLPAEALREALMLIEDMDYQSKREMLAQVKGKK